MVDQFEEVFAAITEDAVLLTIGYMVSRGLAKSGSRDPYDADDRR